MCRCAFPHGEIELSSLLKFSAGGNLSQLCEEITGGSLNDTCAV